MNQRLSLLLRPAVLARTALVGVACWSALIAPGRLERTEVALDAPSWDSAPLRVALLTDWHIGAPHMGLGQVEEIVRLTQAAEPDLILLGGDYVIDGVLGGAKVTPQVFAPILGRLHAPLGVYAVLGNHDWWNDGPAVGAALEAAGIPVIDNRALRLRDGEPFWLVGIGDELTGHDELESTLAQVDPTQGPVLLLTHGPDLFATVPEQVSLTLAGHTHGGQVRLPLVGAPLVPSRYGERYAHGEVREDGRLLYVSGGLGTSIIPVRFGVPPEIALLTVRGARAAPSSVARGSP